MPLNNPKVQVYKFKAFDIRAGKDVVSRRMATRKRIETMGGTLIENTGIEINESQLEHGQEWTPIDFKP